MSCRNKKIRAMLGAFVLTASMTVTAVGCGSTSNASTETADAATETQAESDIDGILDSSDMFTNRDKEIGYDEESAIAINLSDGASTADSDSVVIDVDTITITEEGTYILSGSLTNGQVIVEAEDAKVQLVLDNADITCETSAAIYVRTADKVFITTAEGSENTVCTSGEFVAIDDNNIDAAIFSKSDLTLNGAGSLEVTCTNGHGIVSKDDLVITSGTYVVDAGSHALSGKDSVRIAGGSFELTAGKDGIHSENTDDEEKGFVYIENGSFTITSDGDGIDASYVVEIVDGSFDITAGGGYENGRDHTDNDMMGGPGNMGGQKPDGDFGDGEAPSDMTPPDGDNAPSDMAPPNGEKPDGKTSSDNTTTTDSDSDSITESNFVMLSAGSDTSSDDAVTDDTESSAGATTDESTADKAGTKDAESSADAESTADTDSDSTTSTKGIKADGTLQILGGTYNINSADDAFHTNSTIEVRDGNIEIATGDDGMHADDALVISDGEINITESYEGIEGLTITIDGGNISIVSSDDGLNAAGGADSSGFGGMGTDMFAVNDDIWMEINGGYLYILAGGDGVDSNGNLTINGGEVYIDGPSDGGNSAIDYGDGACAYINGGTVVAVGSSAMVEDFDDSSEQGIMSVSVDTGNAGDEIKLLDSDGNELISFTAAKSYDAVIISTADLTAGETYTLVTGENETTVEMDSAIYSNISRQQGGFAK